MSFVNPIQHKIPSSADYKNINITNFKGTSCSDNLFDGKQSGCSESSNVYINEQNILAVRPRLERMSSFQNITEVLQTNVISSDEMVYYVKDKYNDHYIIVSDIKTSGEQANDIKIFVDDLGKCMFFKDGDGKIICTSETGLFEVRTHDDPSLIPINKYNKDVYIPTTKVGMSFGNENSGVSTGETPNILTDKYYREYLYNLNYTDKIPRDYVINRTFETKDIVNAELSLNMPDTKNYSNMDLPTDIEGNTADDKYQTTTTYYPESNNMCHIINTYNLTNYPNEEQWVYLNNKLAFNQYVNIDTYGEFDTSTDNTDNIHYPLVCNMLFWTTQNTKIVNGSVISPHQYKITKDRDAVRLKIGVLRNDWNVAKTKTIDILSQTTEDEEYLTALKSTTEKVHGRVWFDYDDTYVYFGLLACISNSIASEKYKTWDTFVKIFKVSISDILSEDENKQALTTYASWNKLNLTVNVNPIISDSFIAGNNLYTIFQEIPHSTTTDLRYHVTSTNLDTLRTTSISEGYYSMPVTNIGCPAIKGTMLSETKVLLTVENDVSLRVYVGGVQSFVKNRLIRLQETFGILDIITGNAKIIQDAQLNKSYIYKLPETNTILAMNFSWEGVFDKTVELNSKIFNNYVDETSGFFKLEQSNQDVHDEFNSFSGDFYIDKNLQIYNIYSAIMRTAMNAQLFTYLTPMGKIDVSYEPSKNSLREIVQNEPKTLTFSRAKLIDNRWWLYNNQNEKDKNKIYWTRDSSIYYIPDDFYTTVGVNDSIIDMVSINSASVAVFQKNKTTILMEDENGYYSSQRTLKTPKGCIGEDQVVIIPTTNYPLVINDDSVSILTQSDNGVIEDSVFTILSEDIFEEFAKIPNKEHIKTHAHSYYIYFYWVDENNTSTKLWCLDCRTNSWFKWELPIKVKFMYENETSTDESSETETRLVTDTAEYILTKRNIEKSDNDDTKFSEILTGYVDSLGDNVYRRIPWKWKSRIQTLGTTNYLKKIVSLQFIFSDKDRTQTGEGIFMNNNSIFYTVKTYRKKSQLLNGSFSSHLDGVGIQRIKLRLPKCDFADITLSNYSEDVGQIDGVNMFSNGELILVDGVGGDLFKLENKESFSNVFDRLHLIGITLKILLSEGLNG